MNANDPNVAMLELVASHLGDDVLAEVVFVGGAIAGLLITDSGMPPIRPTLDVDLICKAAVLKDYHRVERLLRSRGLVQDPRPGAPICRWLVAGVTVDVMPMLENILGFSSRWYPLAFSTAQWLVLPRGQRIRMITPALFLAMKLEAFMSRGNSDFRSSHDLEDLLAVVDGRSALCVECSSSPRELREFLATQFKKLLSQAAFVDSLSEHLPGDSVSQERMPRLLEKLQALAALSES